MKIGKYEVSADKHQFILSEVSTVKDMKSENFGNETLINPSYHTSWSGVVHKLAKLELMASVKEFNTIEAVTSSFVYKLASLEDAAKEQLGR